MSKVKYILNKCVGYLSSFCRHSVRLDGKNACSTQKVSECSYANFFSEGYSTMRTEPIDLTILFAIRR